MLEGTTETIAVEGDRRLAFSRAGDPQAERVFLFDPGSFGIHVDGYHLVRELARRGWYAVAYTRAGMYGSDPLPPDQVPTPSFHVGDMGRLLDALGIERPVILAGHSMAGVRVHLAGAVMPDRFRGLALLDAVCPSLMSGLTWDGWVAWGRSLGETGARVAGSLIGNLVEEFHPNILQLEGEERAAKVASINSESHLATAAAEIAVTERKVITEAIKPALALPAFFATATPVSQGTSKLVELYRERGTWVRRIKLKDEGHMSMLRPPAVLTLADGIEELWSAS